MVNIVQCLDKIRIFTIMHENKNVNLGCLQQIYVKTRASVERVHPRWLQIPAFTGRAPDKKSFVRVSES